MARPKLTRTTWVVAILMIALAVLYVAVLLVAKDYYEPPSPDASSYSSEPRGTKVLYLYLSRLGYRVGRLEQFDRIPRSAGTVLLMSPFVHSPTRSEARAMRAWVARGGRLVLVGPISTQAHAHFGYGFTHVASKASLARPSQPGELVRGVTRVSLRGTARLTSSDESIVYLQDGSGAVLAYQPWGRGCVVALSDTFPVTNEGIAREDHYALAANLADPGGGAVLFDEFHHGYSTAPGPLGMLSPSSRLALAVLAVGCILFLYGWGKRLGPAVSCEPAPQRSVTEYAASLGELFEAAKAGGEALAILATGLNRRLGRRASSRGEHESDRALIASLLSRSKSGEVPPDELLELGGHVYEARMGVEHVGRSGRRTSSM